VAVSLSGFAHRASAAPRAGRQVAQVIRKCDVDLRPMSDELALPFRGPETGRHREGRR
jgi:hypothetical protein